MKVILSILMILHGLIHIIGFVQGWNIAQTNGFTGKTLFPMPVLLQRIFGLLWLVSMSAFLVCATTFILGKNYWWIPSVIAITLSQVLIIIYWKDAKAGTIANVLILIATISAYADWRVEKSVQQEVDAILKNAPAGKSIVTTDRVTS